MFSSVNYISDATQKHLPLTKRVELEMNKISKEFRVHRIAAAVLLTAALSVGLISFVAALIFIPAISPLAAFTVFPLFIPAAKQLDLAFKKRQRLESGIFEEVISLPDENGTKGAFAKEKMEVFNQFGKRCKSLSIWDNIPVSVKTSQIFDWAIKRLEEKKAKLASGEEKKKKACDAVIKFYTSLSKDAGENRKLLLGKGFVRHSYLASIKTATKYLGKIHLEEFKSDKEKEDTFALLKSEIEKCKKIVQEPLKEKAWAFENVREIVSSCPNAKIYVHSPMDTKAIFGECDKQSTSSCSHWKVHDIYNEFRQRTVPCIFSSLDKLIEKEVAHLF